MTVLATVLLLVLAGAASAAAECQRTDPETVAVGIRNAPPFIAADPIRGKRGLTFDLWTSIERELQAEGRIGRTEFVECPLREQLDALASGDLDLVISPLTITSERMERIDFTHQYLSSGITVAQRSSSAIDFRYAAGILRETVTHKGVPGAIVVFLVANLALAAVMARMLRQHGDYGVVAAEPLPMRLCRYTMETVVRTIGLKGIGDALRPTAVRALEIVMAVVGTVLSAVVFGVLTTALVGSIGGTRAVGLVDLPAMRIATLGDSTSQAFLEQIYDGDVTTVDVRLQPVSTGRARPSGCAPLDGADATARCLTAKSWAEAMEALARGEVDAVLGDWAQLTYLARSGALAGKVTVQASAFRLEPYGWGVSPLRPDVRAAVDRALMARVRSPNWRFLVQEYMGSGSISPD